MVIVQPSGRSAHLPIVGHDIPSDFTDDDIVDIGEGEADDDELDDDELDESPDESGESSRFDDSRVNSNALQRVASMSCLCGSYFFS